MQNQLHKLRQSKSICKYNDEFMRTSLDISDLSTAEALNKYLAGLKPSVQTHVESQNLTILNLAMVMADRSDLITFIKLKIFQPTQEGPTPMVIDVLTKLDKVT